MHKRTEQKTEENRTEQNRTERTGEICGEGEFNKTQNSVTGK